MLIYLGFIECICTIKKEKKEKNKLCVSDRLKACLCLNRAQKNSNITKLS